LLKHIQIQLQKTYEKEKKKIKKKRRTNRQDPKFKTGWMTATATAATQTT
jgi:hypothetical protein|tara:strand:- start:243 stop:392 length:150 start_codon:yes stop_codon:yes gene_type:complete